MTDLPHWATELTLKPSPLTKLSWASLSDEAFVERLAPHLWRSEATHRGDGRYRFGRAGLSVAKFTRFFRAYGSHYKGTARAGIKDQLWTRAQELFHDQLCDWALAAFEAAEGDIFAYQPAVSRLVPEGCRHLVMETFSNGLRANSSTLKETFQERNLSRIKALQSKSP